ncbi:MAG: amidohydrolase family protein [Clostridia bacterium]|nr:amidohydrolase family protein [Clostridia bacterium]
MIIDFHTHAFPDVVAKKAIPMLSKKSGNMQPFTDGTAKGLIDRMDENGVDVCVVLNIATNPKQMQKVNDFAIAVNSDRLVAFGSVHPDAPDALDELCRIKEAGLKGIKLHPDYQDFFVDEERMFPIYEKAAQLNLITVFHAGVDIGWFEPVHCTPQRLAKALPHFNGGVVVAAHMGGYMLWDDVEKHLVGKDVYFDTGFCYSRMPVLQAKRIVKNHGADKILLGSDLPWSPTEREVDFVKAFDLQKEDEEKILFENAKRLLKI